MSPRTKGGLSVCPPPRAGSFGTGEPRLLHLPRQRSLRTLPGPRAFMQRACICLPVKSGQGRPVPSSWGHIVPPPKLVTGALEGVLVCPRGACVPRNGNLRAAAGGHLRSPGSLSAHPTPRSSPGHLVWKRNTDVNRANKMARARMAWDSAPAGRLRDGRAPGCTGDIPVSPG